MIQLRNRIQHYQTNSFQIGNCFVNQFKKLLKYIRVDNLITTNNKRPTFPINRPSIFPLTTSTFKNENILIKKRVWNLETFFHTELTYLLYLKCDTEFLPIFVENSESNEKFQIFEYMKWNIMINISETMIVT